MSELAFIEELTQRFRSHRAVRVGPGDDTAVYGTDPKQQALITTDMLMEGIHFRSEQSSLAAIGRKALAVNLSDLAAMAGKPLLALVSLAIPQHFELSHLRQLYQGMEALAEEFDLSLAGGDTNSWPGALVINITVVGEALPKGPVLRSGGQAGDAILVTGTLGGSLASGKHLSFCPRIREALFLHQNFKLHSLMDISDGLATDLRRLSQASKLGAILQKKAIPLSAQVNSQAEALKHALTDGEDFELLFTMPAAEAQRLLAAQPLSACPITKIGELSSQLGLFWGEGAHQPLQPITWLAYEHSFGHQPPLST